MKKNRQVHSEDTGGFLWGVFPFLNVWSFVSVLPECVLHVIAVVLFVHDPLCNSFYF